MFKNFGKKSENEFDYESIQELKLFSVAENFQIEKTLNKRMMKRVKKGNYFDYIIQWKRHLINNSISMFATSLKKMVVLWKEPHEHELMILFVLGESDVGALG